jgi:hypothetical protein
MILGLGPICIVEGCKRELLLTNSTLSIGVSSLGPTPLPSLRYQSDHLQCPRLKNVSQITHHDDTILGAARKVCADKQLQRHVFFGSVAGPSRLSV